MCIRRQSPINRSDRLIIENKSVSQTNRSASESLLIDFDLEAGAAMNTAPVASLPSGRRLPAAGVRALPGIGLVGLLALLALEIGRAPWLQANGISALTLAIALGMLVGNTLYPRFALAAGGGVAFSKQKLLRAGIILYGLRLTFRDIANVGIGGVLIDALVLSSTFALAWW